MLLNISFYRPLRLLLAPCPTHPHASPCIFSHILPLSPFHAWTASNSVTLQRCRNSSRWLSPWQIYLYRFVLTASLHMAYIAIIRIPWDNMGYHRIIWQNISCDFCFVMPSLALTVTNAVRHFRSRSSCTSSWPRNSEKSTFYEMDLCISFVSGCLVLSYTNIVIPLYSTFLQYL